MNDKNIRLIVGLGNPGQKYANTPHNFGFMVVDQLAKKYDFSLKKKNLMPYLIRA